MTDLQQNPPNEPAFNIPAPVLALLAAFVAVHAVRWGLAPDDDLWAVWTFGFVPARFDTSVLMGPAFPGGSGALFWTFITYGFLHADVSHLTVNSFWLLPFGSALARRFGSLRFFIMMAVTTVAGALLHLFTHMHEVVPMIGASAAVSGAMGAAVRFMFVQRGAVFGRDMAQPPAPPLMETLRHPRVLTFVLIWFAINLVFGVAGVTFGGDSQGVAWQAHVGGFLAGLLLFPLLDPAGRDGG